MKEMPKLILFDVYETLLDMSDVKRRVNALLNSKRGYDVWIEMFMKYCFVDNCTQRFSDFASISKATMQMAHHVFGLSANSEQVPDLLQLLKYLPLHDGVQEGLSQLHDLNVRIAALTNASEKIVTERMERTGMISYFEAVLSAEQVRKYKPCAEVYEWACKKLNVDAGEVLMVSAHGWDVLGASNAGMRTAFVQYHNSMLYPLAPQPQFVCKNVSDLAQQLHAKATS